MPMHRRWYDQEPACPKLIAQIQDIHHSEIREFCARVMQWSSETVRKELHKQNQKSNGIHSLGLSAVMGLYGFGRRKRRWYDHQPLLRKAVGSFYSLPPRGLAMTSAKLGDTFGLLHIYSQVCRYIDQKPDTGDMTKIANIALETGREEAEAILIAIVGKDLYESLEFCGLE